MSANENIYEVTDANHVQKCKDTLFTMPNSSHSLVSKTGWLGENRIYNDHAAILKISDYIKRNWNLNAKFLFTIVNMDKSDDFCSTCHRYKVNFS